MLNLVIIIAVLGSFSLLVAIGLVLFLILFIKQTKKTYQKELQPSEQKKSQTIPSHPVQEEEELTLQSVQLEQRMEQTNSVMNESNYTPINNLSPSTHIIQNNFYHFFFQRTEKICLVFVVERNELMETTINARRNSQISFNEIAFEKEVGEGSYGKVWLGKWNKARVALKLCRRKGEIEDFMKEMKLML
jgi:hypothetical protein